MAKTSKYGPKWGRVIDPKLETLMAKY